MRCFCVALAALAQSGCRHGGQKPATRPSEPPLKYFQYKQMHMGVPVRLAGFAPDEPAAEEACRAAYKRIAELDSIMSDYRVDSELTRLCARAGKGPIPISEDLFIVLNQSLELARRSEGAFDVTVGPFVKLWRESVKSGRLPTDQELAAARRLVGWEKIRLDPARRTAELLVPGMKLTLGGIGKGYAGDCALKVLREHGVSRAFFEGGGDVVVGDAPPDKPGWTMEVTNDLPGHQSRTITVHNCAISTSGDTEQRVEIDGKRYSHIVDPRTGLGLTTATLVTIVADRGLISDGLSTTVSVLGAEKGKALAQSYNATAYIRPNPPGQ